MNHPYEMDAIRHFMTAHLRPAVLQDLELNAQRLDQKVKVLCRAYEAVLTALECMGGHEVDEATGLIELDPSDYEFMLREFTQVKEMGDLVGLNPETVKSRSGADPAATRRVMNFVEATDPGSVPT